jgi:phosphohistidine phosphatase SixA
MGRLLREHHLVPDFVCVSTALRAQQTAEEVLAACGYKGEVMTSAKLYLAPPSVYFDVFAEVPAGKRRVLFIAHNPGIADLVEVIGRELVEMCTAGIAEIDCQAAEIANITAATSGRLAAFYRPPKGGSRE